MRNISFALTPDQVLARTKTVTRRVGWTFLKPGDLLQPILKGQGLKKGERPTKLGGPIRVEKVSREWMSDFRARPDAVAECRREGFPEKTPAEFYAFFRATHPTPGLDDLGVTRIEFSYLEDEGACIVSAAQKEIERLHQLLNTPELHDFAKAVVLEAAHQRERWPEGHDATKTDEDWFWVIGYLAGKALQTPLLKDFSGVSDTAELQRVSTDKRLHRIITIAAVAANWHAAVLARDAR